MDRFDVVYILKESILPAELIYSLRSVDQNFPHRKVWFVGGQPEGLRPDGRIRHAQVGVNKWERVRSSLFRIISCSDISENFFLFNDDFFVMKSIKGEFINFAGGTLEKRVRELHQNTVRSAYAKQLNEMRNDLIGRGYDAISFALHLPMLINKAQLKQTLKEVDSPMFRSYYGNMNRIPYVYHADVKIYKNNIEPDPDCDFLSTTEETFEHGKVGEFIRKAFPEPSRFEKKRVPPLELYTEEGDDRYAQG